MKQKKATTNPNELWVNLGVINKCLKKAQATTVRLAKWQYNSLPKEDLETLTAVTKQLSSQFKRSFLSELGDETIHERT